MVRVDDIQRAQGPAGCTVRGGLGRTRQPGGSEQTHCLAVVVDIDMDSGWVGAEPGHRLHLPADGIDEAGARSEEHTSELQSRFDLVCRLLLEKKNTKCKT